MAKQKHDLPPGFHDPEFHTPPGGHPVPTPHPHTHEPKPEARAEPPKADPRDEKIANLERELADAVRQLQLAQAKIPPPPVMNVAGAGPQGDPSLPLWRVSLNAPTPLTFKTMDIHAADMHQAKGFFCAANGISDSRHEFKIERLDKKTPPGEGG